MDESAGEIAHGMSINGRSLWVNNPSDLGLYTFMVTGPIWLWTWCGT